MTNLTRFEAIQLVARSSFAPFDSSDFYAFAGVESDEPKIAYTDDYTVVIDGDKVAIVDSEGFEQNFDFG